MSTEYWTYWTHKLQSLTKAHEELEARVRELEGEGHQTTTPALTERELTACMALREIPNPASIEEINEYLKKSRHIEEDVKTTLVTRVKGAVEKGYVKYDPENKKFSLLKSTFVVK